jgi:hypothetical protein
MIAATVIGAGSAGLGIATPTHDALIALIGARSPGETAKETP